MKFREKMERNRKVTIAVAAMIVAVVSLIAATAILLPRFITPEEPAEITNENSADKVLKGKDIVNVLVCGTDLDNMRTDTIMVASYHIKDGKVYVLSIPRDTYINVKRGSKKINASHVYGGVELLRQDIQDFFGIKIDRYAVVNFDAFEQIVDAIGGVKYNVPPGIKYKDKYQDLDIDIPAGEQILNGENALKYVRYRHGYVEGDIGRIKAQQDFLKEVARQIIKPANILKVPTLASIAFNNTETDFPMVEAVAMGVKLLGIDSENIEFILTEGESHYVSGTSYFMPDVDKLLTVVNSYFNKTSVPIAENDIKLERYKPSGNSSNGSSGSGKPNDNGGKKPDTTPDKPPVTPPAADPDPDGAGENPSGQTPDENEGITTNPGTPEDGSAHNEPDGPIDGETPTGEAPTE